MKKNIKKRKIGRAQGVKKKTKERKIRTEERERKQKKEKQVHIVGVLNGVMS